MNVLSTYTVEVLSQGSPDLDAAADVLSEAFMYGNHDPANPGGRGLPDPFYNRYKKSDEAVRQLFRGIIRGANAIGHAVAVVRDDSDQIVGAGWIKERKVRDMNFLDFPKLIGPVCRAFGFLGGVRYGLDVLAHIPTYPDETTYISMLGVCGSSQGKGVGRKLIEYAIESADGQSVELCTMNFHNIQIYEKLGFVLLPDEETRCEDSSYRPGFVTYHMAYRRQ